MSRPNHGPKNRPTRLTSTRLQPEPKLQSVNGGFPIPRIDVNGSSGEFASPKPEQPEPDWRSIKNQAKSDKIKLDSMRSWPDLARSRLNPTRSQLGLWDLARFGQISAIFSKKKVQIPAKKMQILATFLQILAADWTDQHSPSLKTNSINWCRQSVLGSSTLHSTSVSRVQVGSKTKPTPPVDRPISK